MSNIIIGNPETYERKIQLLNPDNLIIIADFDHTITAGRGASASSFDLLGSIPRLQEGFEQERARLFDKYYPYEVDPTLSKSERDKWMQEWWSEAIKLHMRYKLHLEDLVGIDYSRSTMRDGWGEFLGLCHEENIPVHILSAGLKQVIEGTLGHNGLYYDNMSVIANMLTWDNGGYNKGTYPNPPIYTGNKIDHTINHTDKQVLLFGDSIDDASMARPEHDETTIRVAFHNPGTKRTIDEYLTRFDVVIHGSSPTSDAGYLRELISRIY